MCIRDSLKNIRVDFPLGVMTCVTGVSGSGKSSLVNEILYKALARKLNRARTIPGSYKEIIGMEQLDKVIAIDQSPIGRTPRSNPATYTGVFDQIRDLFASTADAKSKGYKKGRFSFNVKGDVYKRQAWIRWWIRSWPCRSGRSCSFWPRWSRDARVSM